LSLIFNFDLIFKGNANIKYSKELLQIAIDETSENINKKEIDDKNINFIIQNFLDNLKPKPFIKNNIQAKSNNEDEKTSTEIKSSIGNNNGEESLNTNEINILNTKNFEKDNEHNRVTNNNNSSSNALTLEKLKEELDEKWEKKFQLLTDNYNEMSKKVSSLKNQVEDLKNELNTIEIRDQIRNLINSFSY